MPPPMKAPGLALLLLPATASADLLSDTRGFLGSAAPEYNPDALVPERTDEEPSFAPFSEADSDLGVQQVLGPAARVPPVFFDVLVEGGWTDNAPARAPFLEDQAFYWSGLVAANWQPHLGHGWFADLGAWQEIYRFDNGGTSDFENFEGHLGVVKNLVDLDDLVFYARYEYQRLTTGSISDSDYSAQRLRAGVQKLIYARPRHQLAARASVAFDLDANPERLERSEYTAEIAWTYWLTDTLSGALRWESEYWDFDNGGRHDWNHTAGIEFAWMVARGVTVFANTFYTDHDSNSPLGLNDFKSWQLGVGAGFTFTF